MHERRAVILSGIYAHLEQVHTAFRDWTALMRPAQGPNVWERGKRAMERYNGLVAYYYPRAIWLDEETCTLLNRVVDAFREVYIDFTVDPGPQGYPKDKDTWKTAREAVISGIPAARRALERRFREILGVEGLKLRQPLGEEDQ